MCIALAFGLLTSCIRFCIRLYMPDKSMFFALHFPICDFHLSAFASSFGNIRFAAMLCFTSLVDRWRYGILSMCTHVCMYPRTWWNIMKCQHRRRDGKKNRITILLSPFHHSGFFIICNPGTSNLALAMNGENGWTRICLRTILMSEPYPGPSTDE